MLKAGSNKALCVFYAFLHRFMRVCGGWYFPVKLRAKERQATAGARYINNVTLFLVGISKRSCFKMYEQLQKKII